VGEPAKAVEKTIVQGTNILADVFDHLPPHPPAIGINIEQITRRNSEPAKQMLSALGTFYRRLHQARFAPYASESASP
jgi:hypothetical protein